MSLIRKILSLLTAALLLAPQAAFATPPDILDIREEPFGRSDTHLFVLRSSTDNLGLYESLRSESFLVAIDLATGEEEHWLLDRMVRSSDYSEDGEMLGYTVTRDAGFEPVNPFAVLAQQSALPWSAVSLTGWYNVKAEFKRESGAWQASYPNGRVFQITEAALTQKLAGVSASVAANVADHPRMSSMSTRQLFAERTVPAETCEPVAVYDHFSFEPPSPELLVRVECSDRDEVGVTSVVVRFTEILPKPAED